MDLWEKMRGQGLNPLDKYVSNICTTYKINIEVGTQFL